jgi:hypothetical protein
MSALRHRFRYVLDGEAHDIVTGARDVATAQAMGLDNQVLMSYAVIHSAAIRLDIAGTPSDFDKFVDLLDDLDDLDGIPVGVSGDELPDPTQAAESGDWQSP